MTSTIVQKKNGMNGELITVIHERNNKKSTIDPGKYLVFCTQKDAGLSHFSKIMEGSCI